MIPRLVPIKRAYLVFLVLLILLLPGSWASAQDGSGDGPVYVVQEGDTLWAISLRFGVSMDSVLAANSLSDGSQLRAGDRLVIPGLQGLQGVITTRTVLFGESLRSLSRSLQVSPDILLRLNHLASPAEMYAGATLVVPENPELPPLHQRAVLAPGQSLLELAVLRGVSPWSFVPSNDLHSRWEALPGEVLLLPGPGESAPGSPSALPDAITSVDLTPLPLVQGKAVKVVVTGASGLELAGSLGGSPLQFFPDPDQAGQLIAMHGLHAMTEPGLYPLALEGTLPTGAQFAYSQQVFVTGGSYPFDPVLIVSPETIDPAVTAPEDAQWTALAQPVTPQRQWTGLFASPMPPELSECWPSRYGNRRSYNGSAYSYFHTGLDFCGRQGTEIYAPADGTVVFAGPLTVRGNATMIDHGWGVYSGYMHQTEILVKAGDTVEAGQLIGYVGNTGRVTGPHLHWEIWAGGVQVDPMDWLEGLFP